jgi:hypothetical protein
MLLLLSVVFWSVTDREGCPASNTDGSDANSDGCDPNSDGCDPNSAGCALVTGDFFLRVPIRGSKLAGRLNLAP